MGYFLTFTVKVMQVRALPLTDVGVAELENAIVQTRTISPSF